VPPERLRELHIRVVLPEGDRMVDSKTGNDRR